MRQFRRVAGEPVLASRREKWHRESVVPDNIEWMTVPDVAVAIGESPSRVRRMLEDHHLLGLRRDGVMSIPALFIRDGAPLPELRGTATVLFDAGFSEPEALEWLLGEEDTLGCSPIEALRSGRKSEVRRVAQALA